MGEDSVCVFADVGVGEKVRELRKEREWERESLWEVEREPG